MTVLIDGMGARCESDRLVTNGGRSRPRVVNTLRETLHVPDIPGELISSCRPRAADLAHRITVRIQQEVAAFAVATDPRIRQAIAEAISGAVDLFMDTLADIPTSSDDIYSYFRHLGVLEASAGHDLDAMRAAHHIATQESWEELRRLAVDLELPAEDSALLCDALLAFQAQLFDEAFGGFAMARGNARQEQEARGRLLVAMLSGAGVDRISLLADMSGWALPSATAVASADIGVGLEIGEVLRGHETALFGMQRGRLSVVADVAEIAAIADSIASRTGFCVAVSWGVAPEETHDAHRWVARALSLATQGIIAPSPEGILSCDDHKNVLCLYADPALRRHTNDELLAPLLAETPKSRTALAETMLLWLRTRQSAPVLAELLGVHEQTVRNRLRRIKPMFSVELADPAQIIGLLTALESAAPQWRDGAS